MRFLLAASVSFCVCDAFQTGLQRARPLALATCRNIVARPTTTGVFLRPGRSSLRRRRPSSLALSDKPDDDWEKERLAPAAAFNPQVAGAVAVGIAALAAAAAAALSASDEGFSATLSTLAQAYNPAHVLQLGVTMIQSAGPMGYLYFGALYVIAEVLAIPALPLTASSGYLFGLVGGTTVVICSATIAAGISFLLGRTFLRKWVEELLGDNAKFKAIDSAIGREGFKIILLLRLSPIFPFAISNYLYGITSVPFWEYLGASMLGFLPGTIAYVYGGGQLGSLVDGGDGGGLPWYGYALGLVAVAATIKLVGDIATKAVAEIEPGIMEEQEWD